MAPVDRTLITALKALADKDRIRITAALLERRRTPADLAADLRLERRAIERHLARLAAAGFARPAGEREREWIIDEAVFADLGRRLGELERSGTADDGTATATGDAEDARVLRSFVVDGRLVSIPAQEKKRAVILRWLLDRCFAEDRDYPEKEVNQRLGLVHRDVAALRRYLVDARLMTRTAGVYRRVPRA